MHVSVSPTDGIAAHTRTEENSDHAGWELNPQASGLITAAPPTQLQGQTRAGRGNCTAMNMYKYKEGLRLLQRLAV